MKKPLYIFVFFLAVLKVQAQELTYVQLNQNLVSVNPSFAGSNGLVRNQFSYRDQWPSISQSSYGVANTFDVFVKKLKAGIAVTADYETGLNGLVKNSGVGLAYAQHIGLKGGRAKIIPSAQVFYRQALRDYTAISFDWYPPNWNHNANQPLPKQEKKGVIDLNAGFLYTLDDRLFLGASVSHINSPYADMIYDYDLSPRYSFYGSYNFMLSDNSVLQIQSNIYKQGYISNSRIGASIILWRHLMAGAAYMSADVMAFSGGYRANNFSFLLGYDVTVGRLAGNTAGSWEFHASYNLRKKEHRFEVVSFEKM